MRYLRNQRSTQYEVNMSRKFSNYINYVELIMEQGGVSSKIKLKYNILSENT